MNMVVWQLDRQTGQVVQKIGRFGREGGTFSFLHVAAMDSKAISPVRFFPEAAAIAHPFERTRRGCSIILEMLADTERDAQIPTADKPDF